MLPKFIVRAGLEPARYFYHETLILARLPISPPDGILGLVRFELNTTRILSALTLPVGLQTVLAGVPGFEPRPVDLETTMLAITNILLNKKLRLPLCGNLINFHTIKKSNYLVPTRLRRNNQLRSRLLSRRSVKLSVFIFKPLYYI